MSTLYELTGEYMQLLDMMEDPDIDAETFSDTLEGLDYELEDKAEQYAKIIKNKEADVTAYDTEIKRLQAKKKATQNNIKLMKKNLEDAMIATGKKKFKTALFSFGIQKNAPSLVLKEDLNVYDLDPAWLIFSEPTVDTVAVKKALKDGEKFDWAKLESSESLRIR